MTEKWKIETAEQAARAFNAHHHRAAIGWQTSDSGFVFNRSVVDSDYSQSEAVAIANSLSGYYAQVGSERDSLQSELERQRYVPGEWQCRVCGFHLHTLAMRASDGAVGVYDKPVTEPCPNDGAEMYPLSWKELSDQQAQNNMEMFEELRGLREDKKALDWLQAAAETAIITTCFELDGGVHVTVDPVGGQRYAARNQDTIRDGIKRLMDGRGQYE